MAQAGMVVDRGIDMGAPLSDEIVFMHREAGGLAVDHVVMLDELLERRGAEAGMMRGLRREGLREVDPTLAAQLLHQRP